MNKHSGYDAKKSSNETSVSGNVTTSGDFIGRDRINNINIPNTHSSFNIITMVVIFAITIAFLSLLIFALLSLQSPQNATSTLESSTPANTTAQATSFSSFIQVSFFTLRDLVKKSFLSAFLLLLLVAIYVFWQKNKISTVSNKNNIIKEFNSLWVQIAPTLHENVLGGKQWAIEMRSLLVTHNYEEMTSLTVRPDQIFTLVSPK